MNQAEFQELGLYDPNAPDATERLALLEYLAGLGATKEDLTEFRNELPGLASVLKLRSGRVLLTLDETVARSGLSEDLVLRINRAAGFPDPEPGARLFSERQADLLATFASAERVFGRDAIIQLTRVLGSATERIAEAVVSAFLINVQAPIVAEREDPLAIARANTAAADLIPLMMALIDEMLRNHLIAARRTFRGTLDGVETFRLAVGFVDVVDSTAMTQRLGLADLGAVLGAFEDRAIASVREQGGRVVKLIGDEVMFVSSDPRAAALVAVDVRAAFASHPVVPGVRVGLALGDVVARDGDYFGPTVNLAARLVKIAPPGSVVANEELARALEGEAFEVRALGNEALKGFGDPVPVYSVTGPR